jgi:hypothetical protein
MSTTTFNADQVIETFQAAAEENQLSPLRAHQVVNLPANGELFIAGDMHDHRRNFDKLLKTVELEDNPARHIILHELIHGDYFDASGADGSWNILFRAAELKCDFPGQVHFLLANHDLAQIHGEGIMKAGLSVCEAFNAGLKRDFGADAASVNVALSEFLLSLPLAVRCPNGIFICHSLPTDEQIKTFDYTVFDRPLIGADYKRRTGPVYQLIWGRNVTPAGVEEFANKLSAQLIVTGHQPQDTGYAVNGPRHLIIASDHNQGVFVQIDLSQQYEMNTLLKQVKKFVSVEL